MKYCSKCGNPASDDSQKFCVKCGSAFPSTSYNQGSISNTSTLEVKYPMKWFKFLIYFALFFGAFLEFCFAINYFTGMIYFSQTDGQVTADMVYGMYGTSLKVWDVIYGLLLLGAAAFSIITRFSLAKYKANGPKFLYILYIAGGVVGLVYNIGVSIITGMSSVFNASFITSIVTTVIVVWANYKYFTKRDELFKN